MEELEGLVHHKGTCFFVHGRCGLPEELAIERAGEDLLSRSVQLRAVVGEIASFLCHGGGGGGVDIGKGNLVPGGALLDGLAIELQVSIVAIGSWNTLYVLVGNGREHDDPRSAPAVVGPGFELGEESVEARAEGGKAGLTRKGLVVAEGCNDYIGAVVGEMLVKVAEVGRPRLEVDLVSRPGKVPDAELVIGKALVKECFEIAVVTGIVEEAAADEGDLVLRLKFQGQGGGDRFCLRSAGRGLEIDVVPGQLRGFLRTSPGSLFLAFLSCERLQAEGKERKEEDESHGGWNRGRKLPKLYARWRGDFAEIPFSPRTGRSRPESCRSSFVCFRSCSSQGCCCLWSCRLVRRSG